MIELARMKRTHVVHRLLYSYLQYNVDRTTCVRMHRYKLLVVKPRKRHCTQVFSAGRYSAFSSSNCCLTCLKVPERMPFSRTALQVVEGQDFTGKTFIVTGSNSGIGFEAAKALALKNAHVVMACRDMGKAEEAKGKITVLKPDARIDILQLDLCSLSSVEKFADEFSKKQWRLDCLLLNAGVYNPQPRVTIDGFEATFQINHLSQFYLTKLLLDNLKRSAPARVVVVSSEIHRQRMFNHFNPADVTPEIVSPTTPEHMNSSTRAYSISKLCNILFANEFTRKHEKDGVRANSLHPGLVRTNLGHTLQGGLAAGWSLITTKLNPWAVNPEVGASTLVYVATAKELDGVGGQFFEQCKRNRPDSSSDNLETASKLWTLSEKMLDDWKAKSKNSATYMSTA